MSNKTIKLHITGTDTQVDGLTDFFPIDKISIKSVKSNDISKPEIKHRTLSVGQSLLKKFKCVSNDDLFEPFELYFENGESIKIGLKSFEALAIFLLTTSTDPYKIGMPDGTKKAWNANLAHHCYNNGRIDEEELMQALTI